jgi:hypothetical protein
MENSPVRSMMRYILTVLIALVGDSTALPQMIQVEPPRYSYHVWGDVLDEQSSPMRSITVCLVPAARPLGGRVPCSKADDAGNFALTVKDIPDKYRVCASTTDTPFILEGDKDKGHRTVCSAVIEFGASDECKRLSLKFGAQ